MAEAPKSGIALDPFEKQYVRIALQLQTKALLRSRSKEVVGSDIYNLRTKEIEMYSSLQRRFE